MITATATDVLATHRHLYETMAEPNPSVVRFYDEFFAKSAKVLLTEEYMKAAWVTMLYPARSGAEFLGMLRKPLYAAPTYQVSAYIVAAVSATYERATGGHDVKLQPEDLPSPSGFLWLDAPLWLTDAGGLRLATRAFSWGSQVAPFHPDSDYDSSVWSVSEDFPGIRLTSWAHADDIDGYTDMEARGLLISYDMRLSLSHSQFVPYGQQMRVREWKYREVTPDDILRWAHTLWMFMGTEIVSDSEGAVARPGRKRARAAIGTDSVRVVMLRRIRSAVSGRLRDIDWACQWVVQAHWRHLDSYEGNAGLHKARPKTGEPGPARHCAVCDMRITHVRAYVKGPDGLPLKPVPETLYRVAR